MLSLLLLFRKCLDSIEHRICFFIAIARSKFWSGGQYRISIKWNPVIIWRTKNTQQPANQHVVYIESVYGIHKTIKTDDNSVCACYAQLRTCAPLNFTTNSTSFRMKTEKVFAFHNFGSKTMRVFNWTHARVFFFLLSWSIISFICYNQFPLVFENCNEKKNTEKHLPFSVQVLDDYALMFAHFLSADL